MLLSQYSAPWRNKAIYDAGSGVYTIDFNPWAGIHMRTAGSPPISHQFVCMTPAQFTAATGAPAPLDGLPVARFTVASGDVYGSDTGEMCEAIGSPPHYALEGGGTDSWWSFSTFIPAPWTPSSNWNILFELHPEAAGRTSLSPNVALSARSGSYYLTVNGGPVTATGGWYGRYRNNDVPLYVGQWQDFVVFTHLDSTGTTGRVVLWTRPQSSPTFARVVDSLTMPDPVNGTGGAPIATMYSLAGVDQRIYPLYGHYRSVDTQTHVIYHGSLYHESGLSA